MTSSAKPVSQVIAASHLNQWIGAGSWPGGSLRRSTR